MITMEKRAWVRQEGYGSIMLIFFFTFIALSKNLHLCEALF